MAHIQVGRFYNHGGQSNFTICAGNQNHHIPNMLKSASTAIILNDIFDSDFLCENGNSKKNVFDNRFAIQKRLIFWMTNLSFSLMDSINLYIAFSKIKM